MLLRIVPDMLTNERYECVTIKPVYDEFVRTSKFKNKYPWRSDYRTKINFLPASRLETNEFKSYFSIISQLNDYGLKNKKTKRLFDLSSVDRKIIACALTYEYTISSGDKDLIDFCRQEFCDIFKGSISSLELINLWLSQGFIEWNDVKQGYMSEWNSNNEHPQPIEAIKYFEALTNTKYPGS